MGGLVLGRYFPLTCEGRERVPLGPLVVAANHFSHLDPVVVTVATGRPIRYLAVDELYGRSAFFDGLTLWLGAIPMPRSRAPIGALRCALAELAAGGAVVLKTGGEGAIAVSLAAAAVDVARFRDGRWRQEPER